MKSAAAILLVMSLFASACGQQGARGLEHELPPLKAAVSTTTSSIPEPVLVDERAADLSAQADLEAGLEVARQTYGSQGNFDVSIAELNSSYSSPVFVDLQDLASVDGVGYDPHNQRVTLYRKSASGSWFCIDEDVQAGTDHGFGDSFEAALADCTDGITSVGWRKVFAADGIDESAIENLLTRFARSLEQGDVAAAHGAFHPAQACLVEELMAVWPQGRGLGGEATLNLVNVAINGESAVATIDQGSASGLDWDLEKYGDDWYVVAEACEVLTPMALAGQDVQARQILTQGLAVVRAGFVERSAFEFSPATLGDLEPELAFVPLADVDWAVVGYQGRASYGLVVVVGAPGRFFCAVESLGAITGYGIGNALDEVDSQAECSQTSEGLPDFP